MSLAPTGADPGEPDRQETLPLSGRGREDPESAPTLPPSGSQDPSETPTLPPSRGGALHAAPGSRPLKVVEPADYAVGAELARGGMGRIFIATDLRHGRPVAIKELLSLDADSTERFRREAMVTARLQHPAIVSVYEAGRWPTGEPFYAMKHVTGTSLARAIRDRPTYRERIAILPNVTTVVEALAYAHDRRVIHRDLKPENVLVGDFGETVVIDWGLAKEIGAPDAAAPPTTPSVPATEDAAAPGLTVAGSVLGTPGYMAPEQARGETVDERADVYALGAILYHLVAGEPAYQGTSSREILMKALFQDPPPLSGRAAEAPADLVAIVEKAMRRDPAQRYPTAKELATELRRFQTGQLVGAYEYSPAERIRRFVARHRAAVAVGSAATLLLALLAVASFRSIVQERDRATAAQVAAERERDEAARARRREAERADDLTLAQARLVADDPVRTLALLHGLSDGFARWGQARTIAASAVAAGAPRVLQLPSRGSSAADVTTAVSCAFSPDGRLLALGGDDRIVRVWDVDAGTCAAMAGHRGLVERVRFVPDGRQLLSWDEDGTLFVWDVATLAGRSVPAVSSSPVFVTSDGRRIVSVERGPAIDVRDLDGGDVRTFPLEGAPTTGDLDPAGARVAFGVEERLGLLELASGAMRTLEGPVGPFAAIRFDGDRVLASAPDGALWSYDLEADRAVVVAGPDGWERETRWLFPERHVVVTVDALGVLRRYRLAAASAILESSHRAVCTEVDEVTLVQGGRVAAVTCRENAVVLLDLGSDRRRTLAGHRYSILVGVSADGGRLALSAPDGTVRVWDVEPVQRTVPGHGAPVTGLALSPDGREAAIGTRDGILQLAGIPDGGLRWELTTGDPSLAAVAVSEAHVATAGCRVRLYRRADGAPVLPELFPDDSGRTSSASGALAISPDGRYLAAGSYTGDVRLWDLERATRRVLAGHQSRTMCLAFSPDSRTLATGAADATVRLWDLAAGAGAALRGPGEIVFSLAFSPDGATLAAGDDEGQACLWDLPAGAAPEGRPLRGHEAWVWSLAFSPDGKRLATGSLDANVGLWDLADGTMRPLIGHSIAVSRVRFSPDGRRIASLGNEGVVRIWDAGSGESRSLPGANMGHIAFTPDGRTLVATGDGGDVNFWPDDLPEDGASLRAWIAARQPLRAAP